MRALLHATLNFGMVFVPVEVATAASRKDIKFRTLHADCGVPLKQYRTCEQCDMSHPEEVKGWEVAKNTFVYVDQDELTQFSMGRERLIKLNKFVDAKTIDPLMVEKTYFLGPNDKLHLPYELLSVAMMEAKVAGIGKASLWGKEYPIAVVSDDGVLRLLMLFCADELVSDAEIAAMVNLDVPLEELGMAQQFIEMKRGMLDIGEDLVSDSRQKALLYLAAKAQGATMEPPEVEPEPTVTLSAYDALKASLGGVTA